MASDKILERIRRLLAMAEDASSPHEAAIAARRARSMMDKHQVTEEQAKGVLDEFGEAMSDEEYVNWPSWLQGLAVLCAQENDCIAQFFVNRLSPNHQNTYKKMAWVGYKADALMAKYLFDYLFHVIQKTSTEQCKIGKEGNMYREGFVYGVRQKLEAARAAREQTLLSTGKSLVVTKMTNVVAKYGEPDYGEGKRKTSAANYTEEEVRAWDQGARDGESFKIHKEIAK